MRRTGGNTLAVLMVAWVLGMAASGCEGRASPVGDGGSGTDGQADGTGTGGACSSLTESRCRADSDCLWVDDCAPCDGSPAGGSCYDGSRPPPAIGCERCSSCDGLDETSCAAQPGCEADFCFNCSCTPGFMGCRDELEAPAECPALGCPQPLCGCAALDETACRNDARCTVGECPDCNTGSSSFTGCLDKGEPVSCPPVACDCHAFDDDEKACRAGAGCTPGDCPGCNGDSNFIGCFNPTEIFGCPELVCVPTCSSDGDCGGNGASCAPPGTPQGCGNCFDPPPEETCQSDVDCVSPQLGTICEAPPCSCNGSKICLQGCLADTDCAQGQSCGLDSRCAPTACNGDGDCPENFECSSSGSGGNSRCQRLECNVAGDCDGTDDFCVEGLCYDSPGECRFPVP